MSDEDDDKHRGPRRRLAAITVEDQIEKEKMPASGVPKSKGKPKLYGYGHGYLCRIGDTVRRGTVSDAFKRGIPLSDPIMAIAWGLARRGKNELARAVLREFGLSNRYRVGHRSITPINPQPGQPKPSP